MNDAGNNKWRIDSTVCIENYGHNILQLNAPLAATTVTVAFEGLAGADGFRKNYVSEAGWQYGFVAMLSNGNRVYGAPRLVNMNINGGVDSISFQCPANCTRLWLVVSGAPKSYWRHAWDDNDSNDEQWPYQVRFGNTNLIGKPNVAITLPVSMISFSATSVGAVSKLNWSTLTETNNKGFYVERSADGSTFSTIGFVGGKGTSTQKQQYSFIDTKPFTGNNYYRLRQEDVDGKSVQSVVVLLSRQGGTGQVSVYPTSFNNSLQVNTAGEKGLFIIRDALGHTLKSVIANGTGILQLSTNDFVAGVYFWQLNGQNGKIVKQ